MSNDWNVGQFMTVQPCSVAADLALADALDRMEANNIRHLLVTRDSHLVGVISNRDVALAENLPGIKAKKLKVADAMSEHVYMCKASTPLEEVASEMEDHRYGCVVVLQDDLVVGIFTTTDAMRAIRTIISGTIVEPRTVPTHLVDVTAEREHIHHHVRIGAGMARATKGPPPIGKFF
jgi:acetoin utilization protein AcuB